MCSRSVSGAVCIEVDDLSVSCCVQAGILLHKAAPSQEIMVSISAHKPQRRQAAGVPHRRQEPGNKIVVVWSPAQRNLLEGAAGCQSDA
jgi:hypothetical protein